MLYRCFRCWLDCPALAAATASWISRAQEQLAAGAGCGAPGPGRAFPAGSGSEPDHDRLPFLLLDARAPHDAGDALRAGHLLAVPVDGERLGGVSPGAGLRRAARQQRPEQGDAAGAGARQQIGRGIAGIRHMLSGQQAGGGHLVVDGLGFGACRVPSGSGSPQVSLRRALQPSRPLPRFSE